MTTVSATVIQAWIELRADDPEAWSAWSVARAQLPGGRGLEELRRARLVEITGTTRSVEQVRELLHASTQVYNPHKERCTVRGGAADPLPGPADVEHVVVWERGGERRTAVERWWRHQTGEAVEVREAVVWGIRFAPGIDAASTARELALLRDARHGLLCNPWSQCMRAVPSAAGPPWIQPDAPARSGGDT